MTWRNGALELDTQRFSPALALVLELAMERAVEARAIGMTDCVLLEALLAPMPDAAVLSIPEEHRRHLSDAAELMGNHLAPGVTLINCLEAFAVVAEMGPEEINPFERGAWHPAVATLVDELPDGAAITQLLRALVAALPALPNGDLLAALFDGDRLAATLAGIASGRSLLVDGQLAEGAFSSRAGFLLNQALSLAPRTGAETCDSALLLAVMLRSRDSYSRMVAQRVGVSLNSAKAVSFLETTTEVIRADAEPLPLVPANLSPGLLRVLEQAFAHSLATGNAAMGEREILRWLIPADEPRLRYLVDDVLEISLPLMMDTLAATAEPELIEPRLPDICPTRNVTAELSRAEAVAPVPRDEVLTKIIEVFFRHRGRVVLLHGERGCGASTMADVIAQALRDGRFPQLRLLQVIVFDLAGVEDKDYDRAVDEVLAYMASEPDRVYVLEGFTRYFHEHFASVARALARSTYRLLILADPPALTALQGCPEPLTTVLDLVELPEPDPGDVVAMVDQAVAALAAEYGVTFDAKAVGSAIRMAGDYMLSARFPAKVVSLLESTCADVAARAEMRGSSRQITPAHLAARMSTITGLPVETILGTGQDKDYVDLLSANLVGQEVAVLKVAGRLDLIQKGMVDKDRPAAVFVFAGLSGTGKTELAKQIAQLYSQSRAMITFPMENFGESHSVSKLIGSPPGYAGFDEGGPLVNALNRDPYAVVLLDEVEKAHPAVWDPFLHLFDEGTITDSKGVTASGTKAFFVMTSNIGQYEIANMLARGAPQAEIEETIRLMLPAHIHDQARVPCFRPEFIGRVMRCGGVVAFNALSREALLGIAKHNFNSIAHRYTKIHEGRFICDDDVLEMIADTIYEENAAVIRESRPGYLGARRIQQLLDTHVNNKLAEKIRLVAGAPLVRVVLNGTTTELIPVYSDGDAEALLAEKRAALVGRVERRFNQILTAPDDVFAGLEESQLNRLDRLLSEVGAII